MYYTQSKGVQGSKRVIYGSTSLNNAKQFLKQVISSLVLKVLILILVFPMVVVTVGSRNSLISSTKYHSSSSKEAALLLSVCPVSSSKCMNFTFLSARYDCFQINNVKKANYLKK
jgi:hypothetical protein